MEDEKIIDLYFQRDETAIRETEAAYGKLCMRIAMNILSIRQDAEECVNDTWYSAWERIPPTRPLSLRSFLGRITRDGAISRWRSEHAQKRFDGMELLLSELDECVPASTNPEAETEAAELSERIAAWLRALDADDRALFLRRYWYGDGVAEMAKERRERANSVSQRLLRLRKRLRETLESEGVWIA